MSASHSSSAVRTESGRQVRFGVCSVALAALFASTSAFAQEKEPVPAVWKAREVSFLYRSGVVFFPCHELENRVSKILLAVGARDGIKVRATDCEQFMMPETRDAFGRSARDPFGSRDSRDPFGSGTDRFSARSDRRQDARVRVQMMTPVAVTPAVIKEIERDKSRRELISRVTGNPIAAMNDPVVFAAQRQPITLSRQTIRLEPEDCELIEQMSRSIFRELDVKVVRGNYTCDRNQPSHMPPQVTVDALVPVGIVVVQKPGKVPTIPESDAPAAPAASPPAETTTEAATTEATTTDTTTEAPTETTTETPP